MSATAPTMKETLNNGVVQQIGNVFGQADLGSLFGLLIQGITPTEAAAAVTSNAKTLAAAASMVLDVVATAGTVTGRKALLIGDSTVIPATGQVVWSGPGGTSMCFAAADAVTAANFTYVKSDGTNSTTSQLDRSLGQQP